MVKRLRRNRNEVSPEEVLEVKQYALAVFQELDRYKREIRSWLWTANVPKKKLAEAIGVSYQAFHRKEKDLSFTPEQLNIMMEIVKDYKSKSAKAKK